MNIATIEDTLLDRLLEGREKNNRKKRSPHKIKKNGFKKFRNAFNFQYSFHEHPTEEGIARHIHQQCKLIHKSSMLSRKRKHRDNHIMFTPHNTSQYLINNYLTNFFINLGPNGQENIGNDNIFPDDDICVIGGTMKGSTINSHIREPFPLISTLFSDATTQESENSNEEQEGLKMYCDDTCTSLGYLEGMIPYQHLNLQCISTNSVNNLTVNNIVIEPQDQEKAFDKELHRKLSDFSTLCTMNHTP